jgi:hypothetical protein
VSLAQASNRPRLLKCPCYLLLATEHQVIVKTESHHFRREAQSGLTSHPNSRGYWGLLRFAQEVKLPRTHGWKPFDKTRDFLSWCGRRISLAPPANVCERGSDGWKSQSIQFMSKRPAKHFNCAPLRAQPSISADPFRLLGVAISADDVQRRASVWTVWSQRLRGARPA